MKRLSSVSNTIRFALLISVLNSWQRCGRIRDLDKDINKRILAGQIISMGIEELTGSVRSFSDNFMHTRKIPNSLIQALEIPEKVEIQNPAYKNFFKAGKPYYLDSCSLTTQFGSLNNYLQLKFHVPITLDNFKILKSNYVKSVSKTNNYCVNSFTGPEFIVS